MPAPLFREPYRVLFPLGMVLGVALLATWGLQLARGGGPLSTADHGALLLWGWDGTAVLGFLLTAYPKQNDAAQPPPAVVTGLALVQVAVVATWLGGLPALAGGLGAAAWAGVGLWAAAVALRSLRRTWDATTAAVPPILALAVLAWAAMGLRHPLGAPLALHGVLLPLALVLLDRILPFFSRKLPGYDGRRRAGFTGSLVALGAARALAEVGRPGLVPALDLALLALVARQWQGWRPWQGRRPPLLGVLHLGVAWILLGYAVDAVLPGGPARHLWTVGGLGTLLLGISIRVTRGHGGFPLELGRDGAVLVGLVQAAVLLRAVLPLLGVQPAWLWPAAAGLLALALLGWLLRLLPLVGRAPPSP